MYLTLLAVCTQTHVHIHIYIHVGKHVRGQAPIRPVGVCLLGLLLARLDSAGIVCCPPLTQVESSQLTEGWGQRNGPRERKHGDTRRRKAASGSEHGNQPALPPSIDLRPPFATQTRYPYGALQPPPLQPPPQCPQRPSTPTAGNTKIGRAHVSRLSGRRPPHSPAPQPFSHRRSVRETCAAAMMKADRHTLRRARAPHTLRAWLFAEKKKKREGTNPRNKRDIHKKYVTGICEVRHGRHQSTQCWLDGEGISAIRWVGDR